MIFRFPPVSSIDSIVWQATHSMTTLYVLHVYPQKDFFFFKRKQKKKKKNFFFNLKKKKKKKKIEMYLDFELCLGKLGRGICKKNLL